MPSTKDSGSSSVAIVGLSFIPLVFVVILGAALIACYCHQKPGRKWPEPKYHSCVKRWVGVEQFTWAPFHKENATINRKFCTLFAIELGLMLIVQSKFNVAL